MRGSISNIHKEGLFLAGAAFKGLHGMPGNDVRHIKSFPGRHVLLVPFGKMPFHARLLGKGNIRSEEHTSELQSLMRISYAVFCLKKKKSQHTTTNVSYHNI